MSIYKEVKLSVATRQAAENYGIRVSRNGMACCIFHNDKTPSMKVDNRYHCFGCQADGDVIDFTARLFDISAKDAVAKLAADFGICYDGKAYTVPKVTKPKLSQAQKMRQAENRCFIVFCDYLHLLERWKEKYAPRLPDEEMHPRFVEALQKMSHTEYLLDVLLYGSIEGKATLIVEYGKAVNQLERRITKLKSCNAACTNECVECNGAA